jgi:hypothetical protein
MSVCERIDAGSVEAHDGGRIHPVLEVLAIASRQLDRVPDADVLQEGEMRVAVRRIDRDAAFARVGCALDMPRTEGERLAAAAGERNRAGMEPLHLDAGDRPGVGPRPRLSFASGGDARLKGVLQQDLCEHGLGVDIGALAEQDEADEGEKEREDDAGNHVGSSVVASGSKQSILSICGGMDCFASLAMTIAEEKNGARGLGDRSRARSGRGGGGDLLFLQPTSTQ